MGEGREGIRRAWRQELPEFTETDPHDPLVQFARMVAFVGHRNATLLDLIASELAWPTLQRRSSAIALSNLVGRPLLGDTPAAVDVLADLSGVPGGAEVILPALAIVRTAGDADNPSVRFESQSGDVVGGSLVDVLMVAEDGGAFGAPGLNSLVLPWGAGAVQVNDAAYFGHAVCQFDAFEVTPTGAPAGYELITEYHDGHFYQLAPDDGFVAQVGATIQFRINGFFDGLLGVAVGQTFGTALVRVTCLPTGIAEDMTVTIVGADNIVTTIELLGQAAVSLEASDYLVSAQWVPFSGDASGILPATFIETLPQSTLQKWQRTDVAGVEAYWLRQRVVSAGASAAPATIGVVFSDDATFTLGFDALQGVTVFDTLGTTTGAAFQDLALNHGPFIDGSLSFLDLGGQEWERVDTLFDSDEDDRHFMVRELPSGSRIVRFGDGVTGAVPAAGLLVTGAYRVGAEDNGNVGAGAVRDLEAGTNFLTNVRNPRLASGWQQREGFDEEGIARLRESVPASVRANQRAVTSEDVGTVAVETALPDGRRPFARVVGIERGAGFKSVLAVCVGAGSQVPRIADTDALADVLNGTRVGFQRFGGLVLANQEIEVAPYVRRIIDVSVTLRVVKRFATTARTVAESALREALTALSQLEDGTYRWEPGATITEPALTAVLGAAGISGLVDVIWASPTFPLVLATREFPVTGDVLITIQEV